MFPGSTAGGFASGPTMGAVSANPADSIPADGLSIQQVAQLEAQLSQKHPLFGLGDLTIAHVNGLSAELTSKASQSELTSGLAGKEPTIAEGGLVQSKVTNLVADLAAKASSADLVTGLAGKEATITEGGLAQSKVANLSTDLASKASTSALTSGLAGKQDIIADQGLAQSKVANLSADLASKASTSALTSGLAGKQDTIQDQGLSQSKVQNLSTDLAAKASTSALTSALAGKQDSIQDGGLAQSKVQNLTTDLAAKASTSALTSGLAGKQDTIVSLPQNKIANLEADLASKAAVSTLANYVTSSVFGMSLAAKQDFLSSTSSLSLASVGLGGGNIAEHNNGSFRVLNLSHDVGINLGVSTSTPLASEDVVLSLDASTGATVQGALSTTGNATVGGTLACNSLQVDGADMVAFLNAKQDALTASSNLEVNSLNTGSLDVKASAASSQSMSVISGGEAHNALIYLGTPFDTTNPSLKCALIAEAISNYSKSKFHICLNNDSDNTPSTNASISDSKLSVDRDGVVTIPGSLLLNGVDVGTAISGGSVDSSTALHVSSLKATGGIPTSSVAEQIDIGRSGSSAMVRISSTYAALRLEGVGQSGSWQGFTLTRNNILQSTAANLGTITYQSWSPGKNVFHQQLVMHGPVTFVSGPKLQRTSDDSLEFYSGSNQAYKAMTLQGSDGILVAHVGVYNNSDASLKSDVVSASSAKALEVLKAVEPKVYRRNDLADDSPRLGFVAQDFSAVLPPEWFNIVGATQAAPAHTDDQGNEVPATPSTLTLDYARLICCLWAANRSMLARIEFLEARAAT